MNTQAVADRLVQLCREGKNMEAIEELYADDVVSTEADGAADPVTHGKEAVAKKSSDWLANVQEFHGGGVSDPIVAGDYFSCRMDFDVTFKERERMQMEEICVFRVSGGKITFEQFFYNLPG